MQIKTVHRIYDDNGEECKRGDVVLIRTKDMDEPCQATIDTIMTNLASFILDDPIYGVKPMKTRVTDVMSCTLNKRKQ